MAFGPEIVFSVRYGFWQEVAFRPEMARIRIELISYILARKAFKSEIAFWPEIAFLAEMAFWEKWLFGRNYFSAKNTFVKSEVAFWLDMAFLPNLIQKTYNSSVRKFIFSQDNFIIICFLSNESAILLKVLEGLARL